eukprot:TRINITY_DN2838_c1_g1_i1.p1 TRINITY_DN2838_c1_g1~~TRINITY_DN2838_c1_g1_i1.p1  ORF type:complete len:947 (-),score=116.77 TRINITY_DN2838_c1_g1_i1:369-3209(-)
MAAGRSCYVLLHFLFCWYSVFLAAKIDTTSETHLEANESGPTNTAWNWMWNNYVLVDPHEAESKLRQSVAGLLESEEKVEMAFKRDVSKIYFTNTRLILRPKALSLSFNFVPSYESIFYRSIKAFDFATKGWVDTNTNLNLYTDLKSKPTISIHFGNGVDIFEIGNFISIKLLDMDMPALKNAATETRREESESEPTESRGKVAEPEKRRVESEATPTESLAKRSKPKKRRGETETESVEPLAQDAEPENQHKEIEGTPVKARAKHAEPRKPRGDDEADLTKSLAKDTEPENWRGESEGETDEEDGCSLLDVSTDAPNKSLGFSDYFAVLTGNASEIDAAEYEQQLRQEAETSHLLGIDETVLVAFKLGRDTRLFTSRRMLRLDVQGFGYSTKYFTLPYEAMKAFRVQTAGYFDLDAEVQIWTDLIGYQFDKFELKAGQVDVKRFHAILCDKILGVHHASPHGSLLETTSPGGFDIFGWLAELADLSTEVSASDAEDAMRKQAILQAPGEEKVLLAFRRGRDLSLLTNKRLLMIDVKGFGKQVEYKSIPYSSINAFAIQSVGYFDADAELMIWTSIQPPPPIPQKEGDPPPPPPPPQCPTVSSWHECMSYIKINLLRGSADLLRLQQTLAGLILHTVGTPSSSENWLEASSFLEGNPIVDLYNYLDNNADSIDPRSVEDHFKSARILQLDEGVQMAFKIGQDFHIWTTKRFLLVDRRGWFDLDQKTLYMSIPFRAIKAFSVRTAGYFDTDAELAFYTSLPWMPMYELDLRGGSVDLNGIMVTLMRAMVACPGNLSNGQALLQMAPSDLLRDWFIPDALDGGSEADIDAANREYRSEKPILVKDEELKFVTKSSRDSFLYTSKRIIQEDVQGFTGQKIEYTSFPYSAMGGFEIHAAGAVLNANIKFLMSSSRYGAITQVFKDGVDLVNVSSFVPRAIAEAQSAKCRH